MFLQVWIIILFQHLYFPFVITCEGFRKHTATFSKMDRSMIYRWFVIILTLSFIPVFIEFSKVQKNYEVVKRPHHRHHVISEVLSNELTKQHHRKKREKAIVESNTDYQVIIFIFQLFVFYLKLSKFKVV